MKSNHRMDLEGSLRKAARDGDVDTIRQMVKEGNVDINHMGFGDWVRIFAVPIQAMRIGRFWLLKYTFI